MTVHPGPSLHTTSRTLPSIRRVTIAILAAIPIAACADDSNGSTAERTVSTTAQPPIETAASVEPTPTTLPPGTGTSFFAGAEDVPVTFALPGGWDVRDVFALKPDADQLSLYVAFFDVGNIYVDGCQWTPVDPPVGPTVDDLASAYASVPSLDASAPSDVTVDGFEGKQIEFTIPDYDDDECQEGRFGLVREDNQAGTGNDPNLWAQMPNQHYQMWILDVDGTRLVIAAAYPPNISGQDRADLDKILNSIQIG